MVKETLNTFVWVVLFFVVVPPTAAALGLWVLYSAQHIYWAFKTWGLAWL